jgi:hypothetical protein
MRACILCVVVLVLTPAAQGVVVNGDFDPAGAGTTHVGADGALSHPGGTTWNWVDIGTDRINLVDENGNPTPWDVRFIGQTVVSPNSASTNDIQDILYSGDALQFLDLLPTGRYSLAAYIGGNTGFKVVDANGNHFTAFGNRPTYALPGVLDSDYRLVTGLVPFDTGGGVYGIRLDGLDGAIGGFQLDGPLPEPGVPAGLALALLLSLRRRRPR